MSNIITMIRRKAHQQGKHDYDDYCEVYFGDFGDYFDDYYEDYYDNFYDVYHDDCYEFL